MNLNDAQKQAIAKWVADGASLSAIQKRLRDEFTLSVTYMDLRLALVDLDLQPAEKAEPKAPPAPPPAIPAAPPPPAGRKEKGRGLFSAFGREAEPPQAGVAVEVDRLQRPGALVSGSVTFSDGVKATWALDQMGRLALDAGRQGYRPSDADLQAFQESLARELEKQGF